MITIDPTAPVVVLLAIEIDAPIERVWNLHTDIDHWADWLADIDSATLDGPLATGASFRWHTHGLDITSTVQELVPGERIVWGGPASGIDGVHVWSFERHGDGVLVRTEESWAGAPVEAATEPLRAALHDSLTAWLATLKSRAERSA
ncbi:SRPBCC family protein [Kitasatospora sp. NPDC049285]|uniref:SRPBCC family protein n=1 Tax=Kitasatospora sp. NPDC049285 TaxID=3157096 RepID=UPI0034446474